MRRQKAPAAATGSPANPGKRIEHGVLGISGAAQDIDAMTVRGKLFSATVAARNELARDRREHAGRRK